MPSPPTDIIIKQDTDDGAWVGTMMTASYEGTETHPDNCALTFDENGGDSVDGNSGTISASTSRTKRSSTSTNAAVSISNVHY